MASITAGGAPPCPARCWVQGGGEGGRAIPVSNASFPVLFFQYVLAAFMLVISSARDSRVVIDSETANSVRIDDERIVREIRTYGYIPKTSAMKKTNRCLAIVY